MLLTTAGHPQIVEYAHPNLGRLVQPRHYSAIEQTAEAGIPWAADNDCFQGLNADAYRKMVARIAFLPGCLFLVAPDVVGRADLTDHLWRQWRPELAESGLPLAYVAQDGVETPPWAEMDALFIGGTTLFKLSPQVERLVKGAKDRGKWVHMGRVNTDRRILFAGAIGCDSFDGSKFSKWRRTWLRDGLTAAGAQSQGRQGLLGEAA